MDKNSLIIDVAVKYGVEEALVFDNILYWIKYNVDKEKNFYDGDYWTYGSYELLVKRMPYLKNKFKVSRIIDNLIFAKLIKRGSFNKIKYDRTSWYALGELGKKYYEIEFLSDIDNVKVQSPSCKNDNLQVAKMQHSSSENATCKLQKCYTEATKSATPIPTREQQEKQQENQQENKESKKERKQENSSPLQDDTPFLDTPFVELEKEQTTKPTKKQETETYNQVIDRLVENKELNEALKEWVKSRLFKKDKFTNRAVELAINKVMKMPENIRLASVENSIINGWKGIFEHKEKADSSAWLAEKKKENDLKEKELELKKANQPFYQQQIKMQYDRENSSRYMAEALAVEAEKERLQKLSAEPQKQIERTLPTRDELLQMEPEERKKVIYSLSMDELNRMKERDAKEQKG